jgi:hypothetical protein
MDRRMLFAGLVTLLIASVILARPGSLVTAEGDKLKGDVVEKDGFVTVTPPVGQSTRLDARNVTKITYDDPLDQQYSDQHAKLGAKDVKGRIALGAWASSHDRSDLAVEVLSEARKIDPMDKEAGHALDVAQSQLDLDNKSKAAAEKAKATTGPTATPTPPVATTGPAAGVAGGPAPKVRKMEDRRLLNTDEINIIRQKEMPADDPKVVIRFENQVVKKYLATGNKNAAEFAKMTPEAQALEILTDGTPEMRKDVKVMTDPTPMIEFKSKVMPVIALGCGSPACHGGAKGGDFALFPANNTAGTYTNFYILQTYTTNVAGTSYAVIDRVTPDRSLVLQYGLPVAVGQPPHPAVTGFRPKFKSTDDPAYITMLNYIKALPAIAPDYGIDVSPKLAVPATQPVAPAH